MYQLNSFYNKVKKSEIFFTIPELIVPGDNIFTIVVGKNGMGKSTLLGEIARTSKIANNFSLNYYLDNQDLEPKVIAISTSPFEKFPTEDRRKRRTDYVVGEKLASNYRYIGMRGNSNSSSSISLISSAMKGLFEQVIYSKDMNKIIEVFNMLEFYPILEFSFEPLFKTRDYMKNEKRIEKEIPLAYELENIEYRYDIKFDAKAYAYFSDLNDYEVNRVLDSLKELLDNYYDMNRKRMITFGIDFENNSIFSPHHSFRNFNFRLLEAVKTLLEYSFIRLMDVRCNKIGLEQMSLRKASSGEQCLTTLMLGISGHITDGSLILIDEPEISLHPMWQKEFMSLLIKTFSHYKNCHFIIATHSPQIIANLKKENCFISSLSENEVYPSEFFYKKSSDFQLARLFGAPGFKNEYLMRILLTFLTDQSSSLEKIDSSVIDELLNLEEILEIDDPVRRLLNMAAEIIRVENND